MPCVLNGHATRALIDTESNISIVYPGTLPGTEGSTSTGCSATTMQMRTVTREREAFKGGGHIQVMVGMNVFIHEFWLADIEDVCIMGLDF